MSAGGFETVWAVVSAGLVETSVKALLLAAIAATGLMLWRVRSASGQLTVWRWMLVASLAMPMSGLILPALEVPVPTSAWWASASQVSLSSPLHPRGAESQSGPGTAASEGIEPSPASGVTWLQIAGAVYIVGVLVLLLRALGGWVTAQTLIREAVPVDDVSLLERVDRHARRMQLRPAPLVLSSADINIPVAAGMTSPAVVLPATWTAWDSETLDAVLVHELSHLSRRDLAVQSAALVYRGAWWPNPFAWWLARHLATLAEAASDEAVLCTRVPPARYAEILLSFFAAGGPRSRVQSWHLAMARPGGAERRIDRVLSWKERRPMSFISARYLTAAGVAIVMAALVSAARPELLAAPAPVLIPAPMSLTTAPRALPEAASVPVPPAPAIVERIVEETAEPDVVTPSMPSTEIAEQEPQQSGQVDDFAKGAYAEDTPDLTLPRATVQAKPRYTADAMRAKLQGGLELEVVVGATGRVLRARVAGASGDLESYSRDSAVELSQRNLGLDEQALKAISEWRFVPGSLGGSAVPVLVKITLEFRLY